MVTATEVKFIAKFCTAVFWKSVLRRNKKLKQAYAREDLAILNYSELILSLHNVTKAGLNEQLGIV